MNRKTITSLFHDFFQTDLAPLGFTLRTASLAERSFPGLRQGICWVFDDSNANYSSFGCHAFWAFTHELDDAMPNVPLGEYGKSLSSASTPLIQRYGKISESTVTAQLKALLQTDVPLLENLNSVSKILANVELYPESQHEVLGRNEFIAPLNHAFCLEIAGRKYEALDAYFSILQSSTSDSPKLAINCAFVAMQQMEALINSQKANLAEPQSTSEPSPSTCLQQKSPPETSFEAELVHKIFPMRVSPGSVTPLHFINCIKKLHPPENGFWAQIDPERFIDALENYELAYMWAISVKQNTQGLASFGNDLAHAIRTEQFDEFAADWLISTPNVAQSKDDNFVYQMLHAHLIEGSHTTFIQILEQDGLEAIPHIRARMVQAKAGIIQRLA